MTPFLQQLTCGQKKQYGSWSAARKDAKHLHRTRDEIVRTYLCRHCGMFHNGGDSQRRLKVQGKAEFRMRARG